MSVTRVFLLLMNFLEMEMAKIGKNAIFKNDPNWKNTDLDLTELLIVRNYIGIKYIHVGMKRVNIWQELLI